MDALEELTSCLSGKSRAIVISEKDVDLRPGSGDNRLFVMQIGEGSLAAGGRGGGFGERKVTGVTCFQLRSMAWSVLYRADESRLGEYEVPYYVSRLPIVMADGSETMGYGVVEPELVSGMSTKSGISSSA